MLSRHGGSSVCLGCMAPCFQHTRLRGSAGNTIYPVYLRFLSFISLGRLCMDRVKSYCTNSTPGHVVLRLATGCRNFTVEKDGLPVGLAQRHGATREARGKPEACVSPCSPQVTITVCNPTFTRPLKPPTLCLRFHCLSFLGRLGVISDMISM